MKMAHSPALVPSAEDPGERHAATTPDEMVARKRESEERRKIVEASLDLIRVAAALRSCSKRSSDVVARYGGEEFAIVLPETAVKGATRVAETALNAVTQLRIPHGHSPAGPYVSISGGVAATVWQGETTAKQLIAAADKLLYEAKDLGRNRMMSARAVAA